MSAAIKVPDKFTDGYIYVGNAYGQFKTERGAMMPFFNMYVLSPASDFQSDDFHAAGLKCEKFKCVSEQVWEHITFGDHVRIFFDAKGRAIGAASLTQQQ